MQLEEEKNVKSIISGHYKAMLDIAKTSPIVSDPEFELLPAMFVVADYAVLSSGKERSAVFGEVLSAMESLYGRIDNFVLNKRILLYGEIIRGKELRLEWNFGNTDLWSDNAVAKCTALLGDILVNPDCAENYDTAPLIMHGLDKVVYFNISVIIPIYYEMADLFREIYDL